MMMRMTVYPRLRRRAVLAISGFAATVMLVACAGGEGQLATDSAGVTDLSIAGTPPLTTTDTTGGHDRGDIATLLSARTSAPSAEGVERVTFEFDGDSVPRYEIAYLEPPYDQCGSGAPVAVTGDAVLQIRLRYTRAHAGSADQILPTVTDRDQKLEQPLIRQLILTCDFEGEVEWLLGLSSRIPFRIVELESPTRLVVELSPAQ